MQPEPIRSLSPRAMTRSGSYALFAATACRPLSFVFNRFVCQTASSLAAGSFVYRRDKGYGKNNNEGFASKHVTHIITMCPEIQVTSFAAVNLVSQSHAPFSNNEVDNFFLFLPFTAEFSFLSEVGGGCGWVVGEGGRGGGGGRQRQRQSGCGWGRGRVTRHVSLAAQSLFAKIKKTSGFSRICVTLLCHTQGLR